MAAAQILLWRGIWRNPSGAAAVDRGQGLGAGHVQYWVSSGQACNSCIVAGRSAAGGTLGAVAPRFSPHPEPCGAKAAKHVFRGKGFPAALHITAESESERLKEATTWTEAPPQRASCGGRPAAFA